MEFPVSSQRQCLALPSGLLVLSTLTYNYNILFYVLCVILKQIMCTKYFIYEKYDGNAGNKLIYKQEISYVQLKKITNQDSKTQC